MSAMAVICEYNPFHSGHEYHIAEAKKACGSDTVVGIMSGFFVQRAEPAIAHPSTRAKAAICGGMDCVIELPAVFSCAAGNIFALGAVRIISRIPGIKYLAMGTEDDGEILQTVADIQYRNPPEYAAVLKECLNSGTGYAAALTKATAHALNGTLKAEYTTEILNKPNNVLAIEYLKALRTVKSDIKPIFIKRKGNGYNSTRTSGEFISATAAREMLRGGMTSELTPYISSRFLSELSDEIKTHPADEKIFNALSVYALRTSDLSSVPDAGEGLDIKIKKIAATCSDLNEIVSACKSKRYTRSRILRLSLQALLKITSDDIKNRSADAAGRLIAIREDKKSFLKELRGVAVKNTDYKVLGENAERIAEIDGIAGSVYALITHRSGNPFWDRKLLTV